MKLKFLKDSPDGKHEKGSTANVNDWRANYWVRTGVAEKATEKKEAKEKKAPKKAETKNAAPKTETK